MGNLLIDTNSIASRAYFADSTNPFLLVNMLLQIQNEIDYDNMYFMFDSKTNFRHQIYVNYKDRKSDPERQSYIQMIRSCLEDANFACFEEETYEADDLLASACQQGDYILTGDKDILSLADKATIILLAGNFRNRKRYNAHSVYTRFGIYPSQFTSYRAFTGDTSDGLPGIRGLGKVSAVKLLTEYKTLEGVYEHINELPERTQKLLKSGKEFGFMTKKMTELVDNIPMRLPTNKSKDIKELVPHLQKAMDIKDVY